MVKKSDLVAGPSASTVLSEKTNKIYLDNLTSSDDSQVVDTKPSKSVKKHGLEQLKRRQIIKKRLQNNSNSTKALSKFKLEKMVYMEKNTELAIELEKQKQLVNLKESEILDMKRDQFEMKEYIIQLENELEDSRRKKNGHCFDDVDLKTAADLCNQIVELGATLKKTLISSGRHSTVTMNSSNTSMRVSTSVDNSKLISPMETTVMESMNRMQQMANEKGNQLLRKQNHVVEAEIPDKMMVYNFEPDDESDELNAKLEEEIQQQQQQEMECDNQMLAIIQEEDENQEEDEEDDECDIYEDADEAEFDENEIDEILDEIEDEENDEDEELVDETEEEKSTVEDTKEDDWVASNNGNNKKAMQTYENKLKKKVSFEFLNTPPRKPSGNEFVIYNDTHETNEQKKPKKITTYEERDNRPLIANFDLNEKQKRNLTPKVIKNKKSIIDDEMQQQQQHEDRIVVEAKAVEDVEAAKARKRSIKKSLDRRRSQAFSPLDSPNNHTTSANDHTPHIQPIEIFTDAVISPQVVESNSRKSILKNNAEKLKKQVHHEQSASVDEVHHKKEETVADTCENEPVKSVIKRQNSRSKLKFTPQEPVVESMVTTEVPVEKENHVVEENEIVKSVIKRQNSKTKLKPQDAVVEQVATEIVHSVGVDKENHDQPKPVKTLVRTNSRSKLKLVTQESLSEAPTIDENKIETEPQVKTTSLKKSNSKSKLLKPENVEAEPVVEFKPPPIPASKRPPLPKKPAKIEEQLQQNPNETYVVENIEAPIANHNTKILAEVSKKLDIVANQSPKEHKQLNKRDLKEVYEHNNENMDPFLSTKHFNFKCPRISFA